MLEGACNCPRGLCVKELDKPTQILGVAGVAGGFQGAQLKTQVPDYADQLAKLIARYNNLDPRGRATLLRMAECMPTGQVTE